MHEDSIISAFIASHRKTRWRSELGTKKRRRQFLDALNHCQDLDDRYVTLLPSNADVEALLVERGHRRCVMSCPISNRSMERNCRYGSRSGPQKAVVGERSSVVSRGVWPTTTTNA